MTQNTHADAAETAADPKFYLPVGIAPSSGANLLARTWASVFDHGV